MEKKSTSLANSGAIRGGERNFHHHPDRNIRPVRNPGFEQSSAVSRRIALASRSSPTTKSRETSRDVPVQGRPQQRPQLGFEPLFVVKADANTAESELRIGKVAEHAFHHSVDFVGSQIEGPDHDGPVGKVFTTCI